jgi:para-nitrobenzyl esterase
MSKLTRRALLNSTIGLGVVAALPVAARAATRATAHASEGSGDPIVRTSNGPVRGRVEDGVLAFRGLRYAAPPSGNLRFKPPREPAPWKDVADAGEFAAAAIQAPGQPDMPTYETHSEDCLFLNVWTSSLPGKRPVMVWLHGGAFSTGAPGRPTYFGDHFARDGIVLVSVTHRLNVFGYAQLPESWGPEYASSGMAGMLDIVAALKWVRQNIARFGGDAGNVTIFGESGGGAKVSLLLAMPSAKGLYHKAVIQSGAALDAAPRPYAQALGGALLDMLGIKAGDTAALAAVETSKIFEAQDAAVAKVSALVAPGGFLNSGFVPSVNPVDLPGGPFTPDAPAMSAQIPLLIGTNKDEATLFISGRKDFLTQTDADFVNVVKRAYPDEADRIAAAIRKAYPDYSPPYLAAFVMTAQMFWLNSIVLAERKVAQRAAPVYMYRMDWGSPINGGILKAAHAMELSFVFGTYEAIRHFVGPGEGPARMASQMHPAWVAFAKTGNPNTPNLPHWPTYDTQSRSTMIFDLQSKVENDPLSELRRLMLHQA